MVAWWQAWRVAGLSLLLVATPAFAQTKLKVVATFSILADLTRNVGGDRVEVASLVGPNGDAHVFSPSPADAATVAGAKVVVTNGLGLEGWVTRLIKASGTNATVVETTGGITSRTMEEDGKTETDPHAWQSVANAKVYVANIRDGLTKADPAGASAYAANARSYITRLDVLEAEVKAAIARIPEAHRKIITTHDAFGYFGAAYGMEFISPEGVSTDTEASAKDVARIIIQIRKERIPAVFMENISDPRLMRQVAKETGATIGGKLYSDALSESAGPAATYIDMMLHNIKEFGLALAR
jgi:zinc/manganese transport system substrate-binding protein